MVESHCPIMEVVDITRLDGNWLAIKTLQTVRYELVKIEMIFDKLTNWHFLHYQEVVETLKYSLKVHFDFCTGDMEKH